MYLNVPEPDFELMMAHLLPTSGMQEQAVFLQVRPAWNGGELAFDTVEIRKLGATDFARQEGDYLELTDKTRAALIKRAHDLGTSLVEIHSHLGDYPAAFSLSDRFGLKETVPHMWWRLKARPYLALVVTAANFDALVWMDNSEVPQALTGLRVGDRLLTPTNLSLAGW